MADPTNVTPISNQDYLDFSNDAYSFHLIMATGGTYTPPTDIGQWTVIMQSTAAELVDGFAAIAIEDTQGDILIINEGTLITNSLDTDDLKFAAASLNADAQIAKGLTNAPSQPTVPALQDASAFATAVEQKLGGETPIYVTGHSLGGIDAEQEAYAIINNPMYGSTDFGGGETFGATGLPGQTAAFTPVNSQGQTTLLDYVDYGDPVGNSASDTATQTPNQIYPDAPTFYHYGTVVPVGSEKNSANIDTAQFLISVADGLNTLAPLVPEGGGVADSFQSLALADLLSAIKYHQLSNYASDIDAVAPPSPTPSGGAPSLPLDWWEEEYTLPYGNAAVSDPQNETIESDGTIVTPYFTTSYDTDTNQITITQTASFSTSEGIVLSGGITTFSIDPNSGAITAGTYNSEDGSNYKWTVDDTTDELQTLEVNEDNGASYQINYTYNNDGSISEVIDGYSGADLSSTLDFTQTTNISVADQVTVGISGTGDEVALDECTITVEPNARATVDGIDDTIALTTDDTVTLTGDANDTGTATGDTITNFAPGDTIDLAGIGDATSATLGANNVLTVTESDGSTVTLNCDPNQDFSGENFLVNTDFNGGTDITVAENVPPSATVPDSLSVVEGLVAPIAGVSVADSDAESAAKTITVTLTDTGGLLQANTDFAGGGGTISGDTTTQLTVSGTLSQVNADLETLIYYNDQGFDDSTQTYANNSGSDTIDVATNDGRGGSDDHKISVTIASSQNEPSGDGGKTKTIYNPNGSTNTTDYDSDGNLTSQQNNPSGNVVTFVLEGVTFQDGATASGSFSINTKTDAIVSADVNTTDGIIQANVYNNPLDGGAGPFAVDLDSYDTPYGQAVGTEIAFAFNPQAEQNGSVASISGYEYFYGHERHFTAGQLEAYSGAVACYCRSTLILTDHGEVAVEGLSIGDRVVTASGAHRPIKWIGRRAYGGRFLVGRKEILPIRFAPGSLGEGLPKRELSVSPEHAMFLDGVLIPARALVDGFGVTQAASVESVEYFHIELDSHDLLIAEGAASESFLDDDSRMMFNNCEDYFVRYPNEAAAPGRFCAPRVESGWEVDVARNKIAARGGRETPESEAGALLGSFRVLGDRLEGWARNAAFPDAPVCLDILANGRKIGLALANRANEQAEGHGFVFALAGGGPIEVRRSLDGAALMEEASRPAKAAA